MRKYELMVIFGPDTDPSDSKKRDALLSKLLGDAYSSVRGVTDLGKKQFRYPIGKNVEGVYVLATLEADALRGAEIQKQAKLMPEVLRYLLVGRGA